MVGDARVDVCLLAGFQADLCGGEGFRGGQGAWGSRVKIRRNMEERGCWGEDERDMERERGAAWKNGGRLLLQSADA